MNSFHDWAATEAGGFDVLARADDGAIEAVRQDGRRWLGIMWHPEREAEPAPHDVALFREHFVGVTDGERCLA